MCLRNLFKRKLRTFLTILGVMVGTAAIVVMISLGLAVNENFTSQIERMGDMTLITVYDQSRYQQFGNVTVSGMGGQNMGIPKLDDAAIAAFEQIPNVVVATPIMQANLFFKSGKYALQSWDCYGLKPEAMPLLGYNIETGRLLQEGDRYEVVFGQLAEKNFYDTNQRNWWENNRFWEAYAGGESETFVDIFNDRIMMSPDRRYIWSQEEGEKEYDDDDEDAPRPIRPVEITVVGQLDFRENDWTYMSGIYFEINTLKELKAAGEKAEKDSNQEFGHFSAIRGADGTTYETAYVKVNDLNKTKDVAQIIKDMGYDSWYMGQWLESTIETMRSLQVLLAAIGAVSLFVAAIGIANTMVMAIYERTREIGVMKVIGAAIKDIRRLFLLESALIGFFGGAFGVGLSLLASYVLNNSNISFFADMGMSYYNTGEDVTKVSLITPWLCGVALGFASAVGLVSGYFPARRAMKLSALSAIRTD
jgi:ABC-type antimicrobial peptide transport system permease subunit